LRTSGETWKKEQTKEATMYVRKKQREWFRILRDLMAVGISMAKIAKACGKSGGASTVQHWADGGDPKDSDARVVLALYRRYCPEKYEAHMKEYEADILQYQPPLVWVKPDRAIRHRPRPDRVGVKPSGQFDFFVTEPEGEAA
jgi:hypothetical protein